MPIEIQRASQPIGCLAGQPAHEHIDVYPTGSGRGQLAAEEPRLFSLPCLPVGLEVVLVNWRLSQPLSDRLMWKGHHEYGTSTKRSCARPASTGRD
jgi:hypothetical protein